MKVLTHNMLRSPIKGVKIDAFLGIESTKSQDVEAEFNSEFIVNILNKLDWPLLLVAATSVITHIPFLEIIILASSICKRSKKTCAIGKIFRLQLGKSWLVHQLKNNWNLCNWKKRWLFLWEMLDFEREIVSFYSWFLTFSFLFSFFNLSQLGQAEKIPTERPETLEGNEDLQKALHHLLLEVPFLFLFQFSPQFSISTSFYSCSSVKIDIVEGNLVCTETQRKFPIKNGIPNLLLNEDEVWRQWTNEKDSPRGLFHSNFTSIFATNLIQIYFSLIFDLNLIRI